MFRFARPAAFALCATFAVAAAAHADTVAGSASFSDSSNSNDLLVGDAFGGTGHNGDNFSVTNVTVGGSAVTFSDFLTLSTYITNSGTQTQTDDIAVAFNITQPGTGSGSLGGSTTETQTAHGHYNTYTGSVTWTDPATLLLSNGDDLLINLSDTSLSSSDACDDYDACGNVNASFQLTSGSTPVPEPASLALLGGGLIGIGFIRRRRAG